MKDLWSYYSKTIITILLVILTVGGLIYFGYNYYKHSEERLAKAITLTQEQALEVSTLKQKLYKSTKRRVAARADTKSHARESKTCSHVHAGS